jgi:hypothetical protein
LPNPFHRLAISVLAAALLPQPAIAAVDYTEKDKKALESVLYPLEHNDCQAAIKALNQGLADKQHAMLLMAGSLYEQGICLKPDWERAANYYQRAHKAGYKAALPRLISGYAEKNRDPAAALWWLAKIAFPLPAPCTSANSLIDDPDAFVAALNKWPRQRLDACVYFGGVLQRISGEIEFPVGAQTQGVLGQASMVFDAANGTIHWTRGDAERIAVNRVAKPLDGARSVFDDTILKHLNAVSQRTLKQFDRPDGIDATWIFKYEYTFDYE